jgi:NAD/NADP transhydrogenase beta subunit
MCKAMSHSSVSVTLRGFGSTTGSPEEIEVDLVAIDVDGAAAALVIVSGCRMPVV